MRDPQIEAVQRKYIAVTLEQKVRELGFFLAMMKQGGTTSECLFHVWMKAKRKASEAEDEALKGASRAVLFGCSAFCNAALTLKDAVQTVIQEDITLEEIHACRHGEFIFQLRNAATHDGIPTMDAWVDGKYYFLSTRVRYGQGKKSSPITIAPPQVDIVTCCSEFAHDWCVLLANRLAPHVGSSDLIGSIFTPESLDEAWTKTDILPAFTVDMYQRLRDKIHERIKADTTDPLPVAISELQLVASENPVQVPPK
ncbi:hypothetical protein [Herbaspirillum camelliae]|uniref:hypothetical protein n=1 Tax=Herbaspirillum camelliae TaxID=1892903 RepID=UPI00094A0000|nr:hypothetical protein [Herbaspirillum camelliae]